MDKPDPDADFGILISEQRLRALAIGSSVVGVIFEDFLFDALERAATAIESASADAYSTPNGISYGSAGRTTYELRTQFRTRLT